MSEDNKALYDKIIKIEEDLADIKESISNINSTLISFSSFMKAKQDGLSDKISNIKDKGVELENFEEKIRKTRSSLSAMADILKSASK